MGEVWTWDLYLVCLFKVCRVFVDLLGRSNLLSPRSNDYSKNLVPSHWKALLLIYVAIGKAAKYTTDRPSLTQPPVGFDLAWSTSWGRLMSPVTLVRIYHLHSVRFRCRSCDSWSLVSQFSFCHNSLSIPSDDQSFTTLVAVVAVTLCLLRSLKSNNSL